MTQSLFWELSTDLTPDKSIIYGTIHLGTPECMAHWDLIEHCLNSFKRTFTESSLEIEDMKFLQPFTLLDHEDSFKSHLSERRWLKMKKVFLKYCDLNIDQYKMFKPLFIMAQIQSRLVNAQGAISLDQRIWDHARSLGQDVQGLETAQEQVDILLSLDIKHQYLNLSRMSRNITKTRKKLQQLLNAYQAGDVTKLYKLSKATLGVDRASLLGNRNFVLADRILAAHKSQASFFSFGAGHLAGGKWSSENSETKRSDITANYADKLATKPL